MTERGATVTEVINIELGDQWAATRLHTLRKGLDLLDDRTQQLRVAGVRDIRLNVVENFGSLRFTFTGILP